MANYSVYFIANSRTTSFLKWFISNVHEGINDDLRDHNYSNMGTYRETLTAIKSTLENRNQLSEGNKLDIESMLLTIKYYTK